MDKKSIEKVKVKDLEVGDEVVLKGKEGTWKVAKKTKDGVDLSHTTKQGSMFKGADDGDIEGKVVNRSENVTQSESLKKQPKQKPLRIKKVAVSLLRMNVIQSENLTTEETEIANELKITEDEAKRAKSASPKRTRKSKPIVETIESEKQRLLKIATIPNEQPMLSKPSKQQKNLF